MAADGLPSTSINKYKCIPALPNTCMKKAATGKLENSRSLAVIEIYHPRTICEPVLCPRTLLLWMSKHESINN